MLSWQVLADGLIIGASIGLGAIGLTLTYAILRFANFTHGDFISWGAYFALSLAGGLAGILPGAKFGALSFGWPLLAALAGAMALTALLALALDGLLFRTLRRHGSAITLVIASFGASLALRNLIVFLYGPQPGYFSRDLQIARRLFGGAVRVTPDQLAVLVLAATLSLLLFLFLRFTTLGRAMRATAENPTLAAVAGIDVAAVVRATWAIGAALAATSGVFLGLTAQIRPQMGFDLLLPLFSAAILGGIGSIPGALAGGLVVGLAESAAVPLIGSEYRQAVAFIVLILILLLRPTGLFGTRA